VQLLSSQFQTGENPVFNYTELTEDHRNNLILASHNFLKTLASVSDADTAQTMWCALADHIHPDLKNDLFMLMLTGNFQKLVITRLGPNMIDCIKIIRSYTNLGLKESKDIVDAARDRGRGEISLTSPENRVKLAQDLRQAGCTVID
jgi:ribosomal protein L7/L12